MFDSDTLLTIAEIAVAFAGFASIASALGRRYSNLDPKVNSLRLHNMVDISLTVVFISLLPVLLAEVVSSDRYLWMSASTIAIVIGVMLVRRMSTRAEPMKSLQGYDKNGALRLYVISAVALVGLLVGATGLAVDYSYSIYLGSLLLTLLASGILFLRVIESLFYVEPEVTEEELSMRDKPDVDV